MLIITIISLITAVTCIIIAMQARHDKEFFAKSLEHELSEHRRSLFVIENYLDIIETQSSQIDAMQFEIDALSCDIRKNKAMLKEARKAKFRRRKSCYAPIVGRS